MLEELNRCEERIHVDVDDGSGGVVLPPGAARGRGTGRFAHLLLLNGYGGLTR